LSNIEDFFGKIGEGQGEMILSVVKVFLKSNPKSEQSEKIRFITRSRALRTVFPIDSI